jgi:hypothetical protein
MVMKKLEKRELKLSTVTIRRLDRDALRAAVGAIGVTCPPVLRRCPLPILRAFVLDRREAAKG